MPKNKQITSRDARQQWREILDDVVSGRSDITITRYGEPVAVLIPAEDYESLSEELEELRLACSAFCVDRLCGSRAGLRVVPTDT